MGKEIKKGKAGNRESIKKKMLTRTITRSEERRVGKECRL